MESALTVTFASLLCFAIGTLVGALLTLRFSTDRNKASELEKHLHEKQDEIKQYQQEVTEHFTETADLLKQMAESYRDVHNHLAQGAQELCPDEHTTPILQTLPEMAGSENRTGEKKSPSSAPLDYAPRSTPYDRGTLNEDYGLEKVELAEKPIEDYAEAIAENAKAN